jgi:hypothetical protein
VIRQAQLAAQPCCQLPPPTRQRGPPPPAPQPYLPRCSPALQNGSRLWWSMRLPTQRWLCLTCRQPRTRCETGGKWSAS